MEVTRGKGDGAVAKGKGGQYMVTEDDLHNKNVPLKPI